MLQLAFLIGLILFLYASTRVLIGLILLLYASTRVLFGLDSLIYASDRVFVRFRLVDLCFKSRIVQ